MGSAGVGQAFMEPGAGVFPVASDDREGSPHEFGDFMERASGEETKIHDFRGVGIMQFEFVERFADVQNPDVSCYGIDLKVSERDTLSAAAAFGGVVGPKLFHKFILHGTAQEEEKMPSIFGGKSLFFQKSFARGVDEGSATQFAQAVLSGRQKTGSYASQLCIDAIKQTIRCLFVAAANLDQKRSYRSAICHYQSAIMVI